MSDERRVNQISEFVEEELGFTSSYYDDAYLKRRISARLRRTRSESYREYLALLREDEDEQAALLDALSVNVTSFFRNPEVWEQVREILRSLTDEHSRVRLWSAACSDGREPYTIAMLALSDPEIDASRLAITATDIDEAILEVARRGVYQSTQTTSIDEELSELVGYEQYVDIDDGTFTLRKEVTDLVTFENHDLISSRPKSNFDLVSCRNLFIYIGSEYKFPILRTVERSLNDRGYLVIGKTETLPEQIRPDFEPIDKRQRIYRKA